MGFGRDTTTKSFSVILEMSNTVSIPAGVTGNKMIATNGSNGVRLLKSALIFGASGVTGWSFVNELLNDYPHKGVWGRVHALTNRSLKAEDSLWPEDERLNIVSGIDLLQGSQEDLDQRLGAIKNIHEVTHVYYLGKLSLAPTHTLISN